MSVDGGNYQVVTPDSFTIGFDGLSREQAFWLNRTAKSFKIEPEPHGKSGKISIRFVADEKGYVAESLDIEKNQDKLECIVIKMHHYVHSFSIRVETMDISFSFDSQGPFSLVYEVSWSFNDTNVGPLTRPCMS